ncbi:MAG TPA: VOC family protein [Nocardioidaceae bacterium]|jgi:predicted enzyme related to lactoylglutathione lyase|nr:VOC family protein [Nocardioidaceae bacterium]
MSGRVVHFEVPFDDGDRARSFYAEAFGWDVTPMPEMRYTMVSTGPMGEQGPSEPGYIGGGMMERTAEMPAPVITLAVDDIDEALQTVGKCGGSTVMEKMAVGEMGFAAYFKDTEGNVMGLWQNA